MKKKTKKQPSGNDKRKRRRAEGLAVAASDPQSLAAYFDDLGPPPSSDPVQAIIWCNLVATRAAHVFATAVLDEAALVRLRGILDAVRAVGLTSSKAVDKKRLREVERKLGIDTEGAPTLEPRPADEPPALRMNPEPR